MSRADTRLRGPLRPLLLLAVLAAAAQAQAQAPAAWVVGGPRGDAWSQAAERWIALDDAVRPGAVQPMEIPPGHTVTRELVRTGGLTSQRNLFGFRWSLHKGPRQIEADTLIVGWHPRLWQSGGANASAQEFMRGLFDGDELVAAFQHRARADQRPNGITYFTLDLGVPVPIDSVVFFPPQSGLTSASERQRELFARGYEVTRTNTPVDWLIFEDESASTGSSGYHPLEEVIASTFTNNKSIVSLTTDLRFTRFLRFKFGEVLRTTLIAELMAFGRGYPQEARYLSAVHSFGEPVSLGRVSWGFTRFRQSSSGEIVEDPAAPVRLDLRTRAGTDDEPRTYFLFDERGQELEVSRASYFDSPRVVEPHSEGIAGFRAKRSDDTENWNEWSVPYQRPGDENRSSDGRQYLQFDFEIVTGDPMAFGVLDSLAFEFSPLLADSVLAEVSVPGAAGGPAVEVPIGVDTLFTYDIRTVAGGRAGFDGIEIDVPPGARFEDLEIDGAPAAAGDDYELAAEDGRFRITLPAAVLRDATFRVRFRAAIYQASVFLEGRVFHTASTSLPQSIEGGDARPDVPGNSLQVVAAEEKLQVLSPVSLSSPVITPNEDGVNDETAIAFQLFGVEGADLRIDVYDLAGRHVAAIADARVGAGPVRRLWGARTAAPGVYLIRVEVDVDEGTAVRIHPVAVAF